MRVEIVIGDTALNLEGKVNHKIEKLEQDGYEVIDVKFTIREDYMYNFYAMIIYKDKDLAR